MTRYHVITNAKTGQTQSVAYSSEEEAAADAVEATARFVDLNRIQFRFMVKKLGIGAAVEAAIAGLPDNTDEAENAKILAETLWEDGQLFERSHPLFTTLAPAVGVTSEEIDAAWLTAQSI